MGKYSLYVILGVSFTLVMLSRNMNSSATDSYANYLVYNARTNAHNIAVSAANICANWIFLDTTGGNVSYSNVSLGGGYYSANSTDIPATNRKMINVYSWYKSNLPSYILASGKKGEVITDTIRDTVQVILQPSGYSKYAYYSVVEGTINWITGDTIWGPFHTQDFMTISNKPVFYGKVTTNKGTKSGSNGSNQAIFYGGYQSGVNIPLNSKSLTPLKDAAKTSGRYFYKDSLRLTFKGDSIAWKFGTKPETTKLISVFAPNGVVMVDSGVLRLKGTTHGRMTVASISSSNYKGKVYIDDNLVYKDDPRTVAGATNILGIVATDTIFVTYNTANTTDINIHAAMFSLNHGFGAEWYSGRPPSGTIYLLGGITQKVRVAVGTFSGSTITHGFAKNYKYDTRLYTDAPPFFPTTGLYEVISWRE